MISVGKNITQAGDRLVPCEIKDVYHGLVQPKADMRRLVTQLRTISQIDAKRYQQLKRTLPYLVCAKFNPEYRKVANFAYCDCFVVDIDHLMAASLDIDQVKRRIATDDQVALCFASPGGDGLKVIFRLSERCYDAGLYTLFYKAFVRQWAVRHHLTEVVDTCTCDVSRACFMSVDPDAYYNEQAQPVDWRAIVDTDNADAVLTLRQQLKHEEKTDKESQQPTLTPPASHDPDAEVMARIKVLLSDQKKQARPAPAVFVPERLEAVIASVCDLVRGTGIEVTLVQDIQYGKKLIMRSDMREAELNIFYGRKGFSVVESPRRGTSKELNTLMGELVRNHLNALVA
ncbi:MAG: virulence protein E [Muribaculaceae bacterium]|nr:virulence protein E [Muribaculaceae bacterium]MBR1727422.1 virulence protein E [Muribaculaceae bacterium]